MEFPFFQKNPQTPTAEVPVKHRTHGIDGPVGQNGARAVPRVTMVRDLAREFVTIPSSPSSTSV